MSEIVSWIWYSILFTGLSDRKLLDSFGVNVISHHFALLGIIATYIIDILPRLPYGLIAAGPPCSLFVWLCCSVHLRHVLGPRGNEENAKVKLANYISENLVARLWVINNCFPTCSTVCSLCVLDVFCHVLSSIFCPLHVKRSQIQIKQSLAING